VNFSVLAGALAASSIAMAMAVAAGVVPGSTRLPSSVRPGDVFVLRLPAGQPFPEAALFLEKTYTPLTVHGEKGPVFLIGVDLDASPGTGTILLRRAGGTEERLSVTIKKRAFPEERLTLPPAMVTPPKELEERIAREQALAAEIYRTSAAAKLWDRGFTAALGQKAAGNFGRRRILNGIPKSPHTGQDYTAPAGTPVKAVAGGKVRLAGDFYYSGLTLFLDHGAGLVSVYMHLEKVLVAEGETVRAGQVIGRVGSTGRATGPHLHLGVRLFEQRVDPETLWGLFGNKDEWAAGKR
jgi:murein DD-endopeptidase MepM/ murein hydrolase activator NlpD